MASPALRILTASTLSVWLASGCGASDPDGAGGVAPEQAPPEQAPPELAPAGEPGARAEAPAEAPPASAAPLAVWLELSVTVSGGRALVEGRTSLPDETLMVVSVSGEGDYDAQGIATVRAGTFAAGPFGPEEGLAEGSYTARASMSLPQTQPPSVQALIGPDGQNLVGDSVSRSSMGLRVESAEDFTVEAGGGSLEDEEAREEARSILDGLSAVEALGRSMDALRLSTDPNAGPQCQGRMADGDEQLRALSRRTERLPGALAGPLRAAVNDLKLCIQCEGTAMEMCEVAASSIQRARTQVETVSVIDLRAQ